MVIHGHKREVGPQRPKIVNYNKLIMKTSENPWLRIPIEDYKGHMGHSNVKQLSFLNSVFADILAEYRPESICFVGCTNGNGFEHIDGSITKSVTGIDINREYINLAKEQYSKTIPNLALHQADLNNDALPECKADLVHCALIFEFVDVDRVLTKLVDCLNVEGTLTVVLQLPSPDSPTISSTPYNASLDQVSSIIKLVGPGDFMRIAGTLGLSEKKSEVRTLESGKQFYIGHYGRV